jgi:hypothetical protein
VINAQGRISIRGSSHAAEEQRRLLESEGVQFDDTGRVKLDGPDGIMWLPSEWEVREILEAAMRIDKQAKRSRKVNNR